MEVTMRLPDLATNASAVTVIRWLVEVGQDVRRGQPLVEVETDKAVMEVESVITGVLTSIAVPAGGEADVGQVIAVFDAPETAGSRPAAATPHTPASPAPATATAPAPATTTTPAAASNRVSFFARNRQAKANGNGSPASGTPLSVPRRALVRRMKESKQNVPHFYLQTSANAGPMSACRTRIADSGSKLAWDAFFVQSIARALKRFDRMAFRIEDDRLVPQGVDAVGVAVDLDDELFTVVVDSPADKPLETISAEIRAGVDRLRSGDPKARVSQKALMTVSNLGSANVESFAAIVNPPESAILAVGKVMPQVVVLDGQMVVQTRVNLTLSVDHRVVNGKYAAGFLGGIVEALEAY
ncbi:2-oxo acid dehydrogenase subunit E2 [Singulisphaera sp. PoT]|uniref:2-oxo acid dehydrogenase subunit E2 n=1 Tax=Singulisphaera sp. PoT TaxID=3411797 RepID=UPI003BF52D2B